MYTLLIHAGNSGRLTQEMLQQPREQRYQVLQVHAGSFRGFRNPPNSDSDYMIFNVRMWSLSYACVYTQGVGHTDSDSAQHFLLGKPR